MLPTFRPNSADAAHTTKKAEQACHREWGKPWTRTLVKRTGFRTWDLLNMTQECKQIPKHQAYSTCNLIFWTWDRFPEARYRPSVFIFSSLCSMAATQRWTNAGTLGDSPLHTSARWQPKTGSSEKIRIRNIHCIQQLQNPLSFHR